MGEVYSAYDERLERRVAIKHIRADRQHSEQARQRLRREARAIAAVSHPAIVQIFDLLETEAGDWIVMEQVEGPTVAELVDAGPLAPLAAVALAGDVAAGLAFAHDRGFVHRDLKAENIILSPGRGARILDFGLCKQIVSDRDDHSLTLESVVVGTCRAMSPEQAQGVRADQRSDLFSLGVLLYECLSGFSPFAAESSMATLGRVCTWQQEPLEEVNPDFPSGLSKLVDQLLEKLPEHRPGSADEVISRLNGIAQNLQPLAEAQHSAPPVAGAIVSGTEQPTLEWSLGRGAGMEGQGSSSSVWGRWRWAAIMTLLAMILLFAQPGVRRWILAGGDTESSAAIGRLPTGPRESMRQGLELLRFSYREDNVEQAVELLGNALRIGGPDARALAGLCEAYVAKYTRGRDPLWLDRAAEQGRLAVDLEGQLARGRACMGDVLLAQGRPEEALREIDEAVLLKPLSGRYLALRGTALFALQRYEEAQQALARAVEVEPESWLAHERQGFVELRLAKNEAAVASLVRGAELAPDNAVIHKNLGVAYFRLDRFDEAATEFQRSLEIEPFHTTYTNLGTLEFYRGRYRTALSAFEKAVDSGAHHYLNWANLGDAQRFTPGQRDEARKSFRRAIQLLQEELARRPQEPELRSRLALYQAKQGATEAALGELANLDLGRAESPRLFYRAVQVFEIAGLRQRAMKALESALESGFSLAEARRDPELTDLRQDALFHRLAAHYPE